MQDVIYTNTLRKSEHLHTFYKHREGNGNPLQDSCLENPVGGGAWWVTVHGGHKELDTTEVTQPCTRIHSWEYNGPE